MIRLFLLVIACAVSLFAFSQFPIEPKHALSRDKETDIGRKGGYEEGHLRVELPPPTDKLPARIGYALPMPNSQV